MSTINMIGDPALRFLWFAAGSATACGRPRRGARVDRRQIIGRRRRFARALGESCWRHPESGRLLSGWQVLYDERAL
jgi:hypothetical protein